MSIPRNFQHMPFNCTVADFHPAVSVTNELGRLLLSTSHSRLRVGTSKSSIIHGCQVFVSQMLCQHSTRHGRNAKCVKEMTIVQNPNLLDTMLAESMIEDTTHNDNNSIGNIITIRSKRASRAQTLFLETESVLRGEIFGVRSQKN